MTAGVRGRAEEPPVLAPMLAGATGMPDTTEGWVFEPKWDGVRGVARVWSGQVSLASRVGNDVTAAYPELAALGAALGDHAAVLDGEIVAFDDRGRPSFERLQRRMHARDPGRPLMAAVPVLYVIFDLLWLDGQLLTEEPLVARRRRMDALELKGANWQTSPLLPDVPHDQLLEVCRQVGFEGYVAKQASSVYQVGKRSRAWAKVKCVRRREFVVGGWSEGEGGRTGRIGSLAVGWVDPDVPAPAGHPFALRYAGQVGSGLNDFLLRHLGTAFEGSAAVTSPFVPPPVPKLHFVRPEVVVEVAYSVMTSVGVLRQPSLKGLRDDVDPAAVGWTAELER